MLVVRIHSFIHSFRQAVTHHSSVFQSHNNNNSSLAHSRIHHHHAVVAQNTTPSSVTNAMVTAACNTNHTTKNQRQGRRHARTHRNPYAMPNGSTGMSMYGKTTQMVVMQPSSKNRLSSVLKMSSGSRSSICQAAATNPSRNSTASKHTPAHTHRQSIHPQPHPHSTHTHTHYHKHTYN